MRTRGVVVRERGGTPFRQIFWSQNGAPANIVGHRWNANTEAFRQITSVTARTRDLASKISKKFQWVTPPDALSGRGRPPPAPSRSTVTRRARGRKLPRCWDQGLGNRSPKSKFTTTPLMRTLNSARKRKVSELEGADQSWLMKATVAAAVYGAVYTRTRCYCNVRSKADISQLNLPREAKN